MKQFQDLYTRFITGLILCIALFSILIFAQCWLSTLLLALIFSILLLCEWLPIIKSSPQLALLTPLYPLFPMGILLYLNSAVITQPLVLKCFAFAFAYDTFCYISGRIFGHHRIYPAISPQKTWEGFLGGWLCLASLLKICIPSLAIGYLLRYTLLISMIATTGDFFESFIKRTAGLKDSGSFLPGHGGLLDRFDSVFFLIYFYWLL